MAKLLQTLIPTLLLLSAAAATASSEEPLPRYFFYDFRPQYPRTGLTFQGDIQAVPWGASYVRLTNAVNNTFSRIVHTQPMQLRSPAGVQADFTTSFSFQISTLDGVAPGDGLVFFIAPVGTVPPNGAGGGNFGVFDDAGNGPEIFAVEFDTFVNEWDPDYRHVGINLGSLKSAATVEVGDAILGKKVTAEIGYISALKMIALQVTSGSDTFELQYKYDLSGLLPEQVQVGLAASTGQAFAAHDVFDWYFISNIWESGATAAKSRKQLIRQFV